MEERRRCEYCGRVSSNGCRICSVCYEKLKAVKKLLAAGEELQKQTRRKKAVIRIG